MVKYETLQLLDMINDNDEQYKFTEESWVAQTVNSILEDYLIDTISVYGKRETASLKEDIASLDTEVVIDVDNNFTSARTSKIELYSKTESQFLDFEVTNSVSFSFKDSPISIIDDEKESDEVKFNEDTEMIILKTDFIYTTDRGLDTKKILDIYVPYHLTEIIEEGVGY